MSYVVYHIDFKNGPLDGRIYLYDAVCRMRQAH